MRDHGSTIAIAIGATAVVGLIFGWKSMLEFGAVLVVGFLAAKAASDRGLWK